MTNSEIIKKISDVSYEREEELLIKFMNEYNLIGLYQATKEQLLSFCESENIWGVE